MKEERDYVYLHVPLEQQDRGAYDEGYYYEYCHSCSETTEHEDEHCCQCGSRYSEYHSVRSSHYSDDY